MGAPDDDRYGAGRTLRSERTRIRMRPDDFDVHAHQLCCKLGQALEIPFGKPVFRTWKEQAKEIVVLQQPAKAAPPEIRRIVVPPPVPAEANEPGAWIEQAQAQTAVPKKITIARTDDQPSVRASADTVWKQALRSPDAARTAIILREIFGPPRGVQSSNFVFETL